LHIFDFFQPGVAPSENPTILIQQPIWRFLLGASPQAIARLLDRFSRGPDRYPVTQGFLSMLTLTLWQPYATFIALGIKEFETRSWSTNRREPLLIHAAKRPLGNDEKYLIEHLSRKFPVIGNLLLPIKEYPLGAIICQVNIVDCVPTNSFTPNNLERMVGGWGEGRYAWKFEDVQTMYIPDVSGKQGLWNFPDNQIPKIFGISTLV